MMISDQVIFQSNFDSNFETFLKTNIFSSSLISMIVNFKDMFFFYF